MIQITNEQDIIGKTITGIKRPAYLGIIALFFDHEYAIYETVLGWDRGEEEITFTSDPQEDYTLRDLGAITEDEYKARRLIAKAKAVAAYRENRYKKYQELRKEFGNE